MQVDYGSAKLNLILCPCSRQSLALNNTSPKMVVNGIKSCGIVHKYCGHVEYFGQFDQLFPFEFSELIKLTLKVFYQQKNLSEIQAQKFKPISSQRTLGDLKIVGVQYQSNSTLRWSDRMTSRAVIRKVIISTSTFVTVPWIAQQNPLSWTNFILEIIIFKKPGVIFPIVGCNKGVGKLYLRYTHDKNSLS